MPKHSEDHRRGKHCHTDCSDDDSSKNSHKKKEHHKKDSCESSSSSSCSPKKEHKKERCESSSISCSPKKEHKKDRSRSRSRSCSPKKESCESSSSSCTPKKEHKKEHKKKEHHKKDDCSPKKKHHRDKSCSSSSSDSDDCDELYDGLKKKLMEDRSVMASGSDCYGALYSQSAQIILYTDTVKFESNQECKNLDHIPGAPDIYVRRSGIYAFTFAIVCDQASQFTIFINNQPQASTTCGNNNGSGQLLLEALLPLQKNDCITIRNYSSAIGSVSVSPVIGGSVPGANIELVVRKISPLCKPCPEKCHIPHHLKCKFEKIAKKMACDCDLLVKGSDSYGSYFSTVAQVVSLEAPVLFTDQINVYNSSISTDKSTVTVDKDGAYLFGFLMNSNEFCEFTIFVNGVPDLSTTAGINKGANNLFLRQILNLKKGDKLSVVNHTSAAGNVNINPTAGGRINGVSAVFYLIKIAVTYPKVPQCENVCEELYQKFRAYLLEHCEYMIEGASFLDVYSTVAQSVPLESSPVYQLLNNERDFEFVQGKTKACVKDDGFYTFAYDSFDVQPSQYSLYVNGSIVPSAISGTESGAGQCSIRQLVRLCKGDEVEMRNHQSAIGTVTTAINSGGLNVARNLSFVWYKIAVAHKEDKSTA